MGGNVTIKDDNQDTLTHNAHSKQERYEQKQSGLFCTFSYITITPYYWIQQQKNSD